MSGSRNRKSVTVGRRSGRRSLAAYGPHARGTRIPAEVGRLSVLQDAPVDVGVGFRAGVFGAAAPLALIFPRAGRGLRAMGARAGGSSRKGSEGTGCMKRKPTVRSLQTVSLEEATAYLDYSSGDELSAAHALAWDRNRLDGSLAPP